MNTDARPAGLPMLEHSYAALPQGFWEAVTPTSVTAPRLLAFNGPLATELGFPAEAPSPALVDVLAGNGLPDGARPIAMAYAGHQFAHFVPALGDGRAILLGEVVTADGRRRDLQLKGAGPTPWSRRGDGRAAIGPVLREYLVSEAMHALGVPTTRSLAAVASGETVLRDRPVPGAVLTRVAASHIRVGTFEYFAARGDDAAVRLLADHAISRHYASLAGRDNPYLALLEVVCERQAALVAQWMHVGFVHGVMNTDNCAISGETIDYGPCAFLDEYHPGKTFSSIDRNGRYAFGNQPPIAQWNLARLAECLLPLLGPDSDSAMAAARGAIEAFPGHFGLAWLGGMRRKLGLASSEPEDNALAQAFLEALQATEADYTLAFRALAAQAAVDLEPALPVASPSLPKTPAMDDWLSRWRARLARDPQLPGERAAAMRATNPAVIPRNHRVEEALAAAEQGDLVPFDALLAAVRRPYDDGAAAAPFMLPPEPMQRVLQTFCGT